MKIGYYSSIDCGVFLILKKFLNIEILGNFEKNLNISERNKFLKLFKTN